MRQGIILILVLGLVSCYQVAGSPITLPCSRASEFPTFWLNSTAQSAKFSNNEFTVYSNMRSGRPYLPAWQSLRLLEVHELQLVPSSRLDGRLKCATGQEFPQQALSQGLVLRALNLETECDCTLDHGRRPLSVSPDVTEDFIEMNVTHPSLPNFLLTYTFSLARTPFSIPVPASQNTYYIEYALNWTTSAPKVSLRIDNWNWTQPGIVNSSLRLYFLGGCTIPLSYYLNNLPSHHSILTPARKI